MLYKNFITGRINLDADERLLPAGDARELRNVEVINSEASDQGSVQNSLSTKQLTTLSYGSNPRTLGKFSDDAEDKLYWFVKSDTGCYLVEWDNVNQVSSFVLSDTRTEDSTRVLNLKDGFLITGVIKVISEDTNEDLLMWTDDNIEPCCINIERAKTWGTNGFSKEDIYLIKKQPKNAPVITPTYSSEQSNYIEELFVSFGYRYKYRDGERSAISSYSNYQFTPKKFKMDYHTRENVGMVNGFNALRISINTGEKQVTDVEVIGKRSNSNALYLISSFSKKNEGWGDNESKDFVFSNNKIYTVLAEKELFRTFDNVPRKAKALALIKNVPVFGNYLEGYDVKDANGVDIKMDYAVGLVSNDISGDVLTVTINGTNDKLTIDIPSDIELNKDTRLIFDLKLNNTTYTGTYDNLIEFILPTDYANATALAVDTDFKFFIGTVLTNDFLTKYSITVAGTWSLASNVPFSISASTSTSITIKAIVLTYNTGGSPATQAVPFYFQDTTSVVYSEIKSYSSCKTNRDYEVGIIYQDHWTRKSTVLTSNNNTVYIPQNLSIFQNKLLITLTNPPPFWAETYKLVVKAEPLKYQTIYANLFYIDGVYRWVKLEGEDRDKIKTGDFLIVKSDLSGPVTDIVKVKVLEVTDKDKDFITGNLDSDSNEISEEAGLYMKIKPSGFDMKYSEDSFIVREDFDSRHDDPNPTIDIDVSETPITAGARITIFIESWEKKKSDKYWSFDKTYISTTSYASFKLFYDAEVTSLGDFETEYVTIDFSNAAVYTVVSKEGGYGLGGDRRLNGMITIQNTGLLIFETSPKQAENNIYYETPQTFDIIGGNHQGNVQNQNGASPAIINLDFFNCFVQGNGAESYRVKDAFNANFLNIDLKPTSTSIEGYKEIRRFADLTYGEPYMESSGFNGLNVFNLSTINFKELDKQNNSIQFLFSRNTNLVALQEDKTGYVLFGKDLMLLASGVPIVGKTPEILGEYVPFQGENGCGKHPESVAWDAYRLYFVNPSRGTPIRLSMDGTEEINYGTQGYFRDIFINNPTSKKQGGYDPYSKRYSITISDEPESVLNLVCGNNVVKKLDGAFNYTFTLNNLLGNVVINYTITGGYATVQSVFGAIITVDSNVTGSGNLTFARGSLAYDKVYVTVTPVSGTPTIEMTNICPVGTELKLITVVVNDATDVGKTIINRFNHNNGTFYSDNQYFAEPSVSKFLVETGVEGVGKFPKSSEVVNIQSFKDVSSTASFKPLQLNALRYLVSTNLYSASDVNTILSLSNLLSVTNTVISAGSEINSGSFTFTRPTVNHNLYLIWDYSDKNEAPVAVNDSASVNKGAYVDIDVLANDTDPDGDTLTPIVVSSPTHGTAVVQPDKKIRYTHDGSDSFTDSFTYKVSDGLADSNVAVVDLSVGVDCSAGIVASGSVGVYEAIIVLGTGTGTAGITYDAFGVPDRFQIEYDGVIVADSKYVGDSLGGSPPSFSGLIGTHTGLKKFTYNGTGFDDTGTTVDVTVGASDVADGSGSEPTNGNGSLFFSKPNATPTTMKLIVTAPVGGTAWNMNGVCPTP